LIEIEHVTKRYGAVTSVDDVSFSVPLGEVVGFVGPNGAGKSTTMKIIACLLPPNEGSVKVAGFDTVYQSTNARRNLGYLPESVPLYADMTVRSYLDYMGALRDIPKRERGRLVDGVIDKVGVGEYRNRSIRTLSKGYRQRVGIGQAILHEPPVVILDEPTNGLDPAQMVEMRKLIKDLGKDHAVLLSSHLLSEIALICDRMVVISRGRIVGDGSIGELAKTAKLGASATAEDIFMSLTGTAEAQATDG
jgi:ABC-2 type transport system ATP-binding protein